jgi:hypothetical protein
MAHTITTRGFVRCCGVPLRHGEDTCAKCGQDRPDPNTPMWVGRAAWLKMRGRSEKLKVAAPKFR